MQIEFFAICLYFFILMTSLYKYHNALILIYAKLCGPPVDNHYENAYLYSTSYAKHSDDMADPQKFPQLIFKKIC